jgi:putative oxygen-independent coproporphyrinogen III oxidase
MIASAPRSAYLHIPFCHRRCFYCDFAVVPLGDRADAFGGSGSGSIEAYLDLLSAEISLSPQGPALATVYVGGGTPSLLRPDQISGLLQQLRGRFGFQQGAEITLEMDPATFEQSDLQSLIAAGVTRVSLGGQSFDDERLAALGRRHRRQDLLEACHWLQESLQVGGLQSWSLDLIRNLPDQGDEEWEAQLEQAVAVQAPHVSIYDLSVEPGTVFAWREKRGELALPEEDAAADRIAFTSRRLRRAGYSRYEISNFARPGHASRHNLGESGWPVLEPVRPMPPGCRTKGKSSIPAWFVGQRGACLWMIACSWDCAAMKAWTSGILRDAAAGTNGVATEICLP